MNIGVTGASGYLGSNLVKSLRAEGNNVYPFVRSPVDEGDVEFSLSNIPSMCRHLSNLKIDVLVHCAWDLKITDLAKFNNKRK